jgi:hypothetical protein
VADRHQPARRAGYAAVPTRPSLLVAISVVIIVWTLALGALVSAMFYCLFRRSGHRFGDKEHAPSKHRPFPNEGLARCDSI